MSCQFWIPGGSVSLADLADRVGRLRPRPTYGEPNGQTPPDPLEGPSGIAETLDVSVAAIENIRKRYVLEGLEGRSNARSNADLRAGASSMVRRDPGSWTSAAAKCHDGHGNWTLPMLADQLVELNIVETVLHRTVRGLAIHHPLRTHQAEAPTLQDSD